MVVKCVVGDGVGYCESVCVFGVANVSRDVSRFEIE